MTLGFEPEVCVHAPSKHGLGLPHFNLGKMAFCGQYTLTHHLAAKPFYRIGLLSASIPRSDGILYVDFCFPAFPFGYSQHSDSSDPGCKTIGSFLDHNWGVDQRRSVMARVVETVSAPASSPCPVLPFSSLMQIFLVIVLVCVLC